MPTIADRPDRPTAIQTNLAAIFISLELSRSIWLITSLSPGFGERMRSIPCERGMLRHCWRGFRSCKRKRWRGRGNIADHRRPGSRAGWFLASSSAGAGRIESHVVDPASIATSRRRRRAKTDRIDGEMRFALCWRISAANPGSARW